MEGGRRGSGDRTGTPRGELARIRAGRERQGRDVRRGIMDAMLESAGLRGYRNVSVQDVIDRCDGNRVQFYRHFGSKEECFAAAYEEEIEGVVAEVREAAGRASGWRLGLREALWAVSGYLERRPLAARALAVEVHVAGGRAAEKRAEIHEIAVAAIDRGRHEGGPAADAPALAAAFLLGAIESTLVAALGDEEPSAFGAAVPDLTHLVVATFLDESAAAEDMAAASAS